jgi:hypothetical protein
MFFLLNRYGFLTFEHKKRAARRKQISPAPSTTLKFPIRFKSRSLPGNHLTQNHLKDLDFTDDFPRSPACNLSSAPDAPAFFQNIPRGEVCI